MAYRLHQYFIGYKIRFHGFKLLAVDRSRSFPIEKWTLFAFETGFSLAIMVSYGSLVHNGDDENALRVKKVYCLYYWGLDPSSPNH